MKSSLYLGLKAINDGRFDQAVAILEAVTKVSPQDPKVWLALGRAYSGAQETAKATAAYSLVMALNPEESELEAAQRELARIEDQSRTVIKEALRVPCGACGALIPASRAGRPWCLCGWNARTPPIVGRQVFLHDVFAYAAHRGVSVSFRRFEDVFVVAKQAFSLQGMGTKVYPVDPRLVLPLAGRLPLLSQADLRPVSREGGPEGLFRVRALGDPTGGRYLTWQQMVAHLSEIEEMDVSHRPPDGSVGPVLIALGRLTPEDVEKARRHKEAGETVGAALVRFRYLTLEELLQAVIGGGRLGPQPVRPFDKRLGERLVAKGAVERQRLKHVLFLQSQVQRPLGELLVEAHLVTPQSLEAALKGQPPAPRDLPQADGVGEVLAGFGKLTWTQLVALQAELGPAGAYGGQPLIELMRARKSVPAAALEQALMRRERKLALVYQGYMRLGAVLIAQRAITPEALGQALMAQIDDPRPLGQILVERGTITPEQLVAALEEQMLRRDRAAIEDLSEFENARPAARPRGPSVPTRSLTRSLDMPEVEAERPRKGARRPARARRWPLVLVALLAIGALAIGMGLYVAHKHI